MEAGRAAWALGAAGDFAPASAPAPVTEAAGAPDARAGLSPEPNRAGTHALAAARLARFTFRGQGGRPPLVSSPATGGVVCIGILVADLFVPPLAHLPAAGELVTTDDFLVAPGGCAANSAVALGRLGVPVAVCGRVGDDVFGELVVRDLRGRGIDTRAVAVTEATSTSKTVIVPVTGEDRRYIHTVGANARFHRSPTWRRLL